MTRKKISSPDDYWRPVDRKGRTCQYTFRGTTCTRRGAHRCMPRADRAVAFFSGLLVHVKGPHARHPFILRDWQEHDIIRPLFGEVVWSNEWNRYVRRYRKAYIVLARKNGKSELMSGLALLLLVGDDEEAAEVYGAARDTKQAGKVFEPAARMVQLSPPLSKRLHFNRQSRRLVDNTTASYYETITADALGELGHNPHGFILDEVLSQRNNLLLDTMETAAGTRTQPMICCITTETSDSASFGAALIDEAERIQEDPKRAPHVFTYVRKLPANEEALARLQRLFPDHPDLPVSIDPWDERNWKWPNPALDDFLSREALRQEALEAKNERTKENPFRQFRMNQRTQQVTRLISLDLWDSCVEEIAATPDWLNEKLKNQRCWGGLDLSSRLDLTAWCLYFESGWTLWRFWCPEDVVPLLDEHTAGRFSQWCKAGWVTLTDGDTIDYDQIYADVEADNERYVITEVAYDKWSGEPVRQEIEKRTGLRLVESGTTYERMTGPMTEFLRLLRTREISHGGNPVARWMADNIEAKTPRDDPDRMRPVKPIRERTGKRIDGMVALFLAISSRQRGTEPTYDILESVR